MILLGRIEGHRSQQMIQSPGRARTLILNQRSFDEYTSVPDASGKDG